MSHLRVDPGWCLYRVPRHHLSCSSRFLAYQSAIRTIRYALHRSPALPSLVSRPFINYEWPGYEATALPYVTSVQHGGFIIPSEARLYSGSIEICVVIIVVVVNSDISTMMIFWMLLIGSILIEWPFWTPWTVIKTDVHMYHLCRWLYLNAKYVKFSLWSIPEFNPGSCLKNTPESISGGLRFKFFLGEPDPPPPRLKCASTL